MAILYRRHGGLVYRFSLRLLHDEWLAEEVTQEVFLALLRQSGSFDAERASLPTWLCGIARRHAWKQLRTRVRHAADELNDDDESPAPDPAEILTSKELMFELERGIDALPADLRAVVALCELEEMNYEDVASVLEIPLGTVRSRLHRAKRRLAALLSTALVKKEGE